MPDWAAGVASAAVGVISFVLAWFFYKVLGKIEWIAPVFVAVGTITMLGTGLGAKVQGMATGVVDTLSTKIQHFTGVSITLTLIIALVTNAYFWIHTFKDRQVHRSTLWSAVIGPSTAPFIPGIAGSFLMGAYGVIGQIVASLIGAMFGVR